MPLMILLVILAAAWFTFLAVGSIFIGNLPGLVVCGVIAAALWYAVIETVYSAPSTDIPDIFKDR